MIALLKKKRKNIILRSKASFYSLLFSFLSFCRFFHFYIHIHVHIYIHTHTQHPTLFCFPFHTSSPPPIHSSIPCYSLCAASVVSHQKAPFPSFYSHPPSTLWVVAAAADPKAPSCPGLDVPPFCLREPFWRRQCRLRSWCGHRWKTTCLSVLPGRCTRPGSRGCQLDTT